MCLSPVDFEKERGSYRGEIKRGGKKEKSKRYEIRGLKKERGSKRIWEGVPLERKKAADFL